ncbi:MAG: Spy/CpxP family protein refolding chaperone [Rhodocyclales bacterium]|nr:Spy/CpxP family protein refolding chaperone [Rhodocyclales bacterium]
MNLNRKIIAGFLAASAVMFGVAYAQGPGCGSDGKPGMMRGAMQGRMMDPDARVEQRLTRLKSALKLTPQQEPLWQAFAEKSKAEAGKGIQAMRERMKDDKQVTAPERFTQMQDGMKQRLAAMESINESFNRLYAVLMPEQKAAADKQFSSAGRHHHGPRRGPPQREGQGVPKAAEPIKG